MSKVSSLTGITGKAVNMPVILEPDAPIVLQFPDPKYFTKYTDLHGNDWVWEDATKNWVVITRPTWLEDTLSPYPSLRKDSAWDPEVNTSLYIGGIEPDENVHVKYALEGSVAYNIISKSMITFTHGIWVSWLKTRSIARVNTYRWAAHPIVPRLLLVDDANKAYGELIKGDQYVELFIAGKLQVEGLDFIIDYSHNEIIFVFPRVLESQIVFKVYTTGERVDPLHPYVYRAFLGNELVEYGSNTYTIQGGNFGPTTEVYTANNEVLFQPITITATTMLFTAISKYGVGTFPVYVNNGENSPQFGIPINITVNT